MSSSDRAKLDAYLAGRTKPDFSWVPAGCLHFGLTDEEVDSMDPNGYHQMNADENRRYCSQVRETLGFDVDRIPLAIDFGLIIPCDIDLYVDHLQRYTQFAIDHNQKTTGQNLKLVKYIKWNHQVASPMNYYITFEAKDADTGEHDVYQAKVVRRFPEKETHVEIFRRKPKPLEQKLEEQHCEKALPKSKEPKPPCEIETATDSLEQEQPKHSLRDIENVQATDNAAPVTGHKRSKPS